MVEVDDVDWPILRITYHGRFSLEAPERALARETRGAMRATLTPLPYPLVIVSSRDEAVACVEQALADDARAPKVANGG